MIVRWLKRKLHHRKEARVKAPQPAVAPDALQARFAALDTRERAVVDQLVESHLRVRDLTEQRPELAHLLGPVVQSSFDVAREGLLGILDDHERA